MTPSDLRTIRDKLKLTQGQFAALLGLTRDGIASMEQGRRPISRVVDLAIEHLSCKKRRT